MVAALEAEGLHPIYEYIRRFQATVAAQVACRPIYELCTEAEQRMGMVCMMRLWDQDLLHESEEETENLCTLT